MSRMNLLLAALTLIVAGTASATRTIEQPEGAYESSLRDVIMPGGSAGYVIFKPCSACDSISLNVTADTAYFVRSTALPLPDFLQAAESFRDQGETGVGTAVYVFYDVETKRVNRLVLAHFGD